MVPLTDEKDEKKQSIDGMIKAGLSVTQIAEELKITLSDVIDYRIKSKVESEAVRKASLLPENYHPDTDFKDLKYFLECMKGENTISEKTFPRDINCESNRFVYLLKIINGDSEGAIYNRIMGEVNKNEMISAMFEVSAKFYDANKFMHELIDLNREGLIKRPSHGSARGRYTLDPGLGRDFMDYLKRNCEKL